MQIENEGGGEEVAGKGRGRPIFWKIRFQPNFRFYSGLECQMRLKTRRMFPERARPLE
jgi:hypothetical protein